MCTMYWIRTLSSYMTAGRFGRTCLSRRISQTRNHADAGSKRTWLHSLFTLCDMILRNVLTKCMDYNMEDHRYEKYLNILIPKISVFFDVTAFSSFRVSRRFGGTCRLHLQRHLHFHIAHKIEHAHNHFCENLKPTCSYIILI
jgi:hypothetical protein